MAAPLILPAEMRDAILQYLATRPWGEANPIIQALASLSEIKVTDDEPR
jgi:hypothetical protein